MKFAAFEPMAVAPGTPVTVLVDAKVGPWVCIPLHALPDRVATDLLVHFLGETETARRLFDEVSWEAVDGTRRPRRLVYVVGSKAISAMRATLELEQGEPWPAEIEVFHLHG